MLGATVLEAPGRRSNESRIIKIKEQQAATRRLSGVGGDSPATTVAAVPRIIGEELLRSQQTAEATANTGWR